ncbi:MAG: tryptophanase [Oligoflexia bacterium]|nr:tryptophanase [Oligoflexia bacterium]
MSSAVHFEPFKIKSVEPLPASSASERESWIRTAGYNVFSLTSSQVIIDLLTDSGTSAMSDKQWAEMMKADESYAGSRSFIELEDTARKLTGMDYIIPVHQGRAAEHLLFPRLLKSGQKVLSNGLFDTTLANIQAVGAQGVNLRCKEACDPFALAPFKGNIDLEQLQATLSSEGEKAALVVMTITNNTGGGQPVSLSNLQEAARITHAAGKLLVLDACRFAENSMLIKQREAGFDNLAVREIASRCFACADAVTFSGKKDALANIGGLLCLRDHAISEDIKASMLVVEGFPTYGGLAGYSLAAMNQGLHEVLDERYLAYRLRTIDWMVERLAALGVPVIQPAGGHAVYIEASRFYPHIPREQFPGIALTTDLYIEGGIRGCELGSVAFGFRDKNGKHVLPPLDLVRLAIPRRVYTEAHMGYVVEVLASLYRQSGAARGFEFSEEYTVLRHFRSKFRRLT